MSGTAKCPTCNGTGEIDAQMAGLAAMVKATRLAAGFTQIQLAEQTGLSRSAIANIESGRQSIPIARIRPLARALGIPPEDLLP